jgi:hypothetical protein
VVGRVDDLLGLLAVVGDDHQRQHAADRVRATLFAQVHEFAVHLRRRGGGQVDDHGRLQ